MQQKKLLIMNILDILKKYTDENHRLIQKEIVEILDNEYDMKTDRKSVKKRVSFLYYEYGTDKKLHYRKRPDRSVREYIINPYQMAAKEGKYYLICNYDKYNNISNCRIDRIAERKILDTPAKPFEKLDGAEKQRLNLSKYMGEHIYMFSSKTVRVKFRITKPMISDVIDMFGNDVRFTDETDSFVTVTANANEMSMLQFVKSFAPDVVVLEPKQLRDKIKNDLERSLKKYKI